MFKIYDGRKEFYQWDLNQKLIVNDKDINEVHFCNRTDDCSLVCEVYYIDDLRVVDVPNILFQNDWRIRAYAYSTDHTKTEVIFNVRSRTKPADYVYTETEVKRYEDLEARLEALEQSGGGTSGGNNSYIDVTDQYEEYSGSDASFFYSLGEGKYSVDEGSRLYQCDNVDYYGCLYSTVKSYGDDRILTENIYIDGELAFEKESFEDGEGLTALRHISKPYYGTDAANKDYVDEAIANLPTGGSEDKPMELLYSVTTEEDVLDIMSGIDPHDYTEILMVARAVSADSSKTTHFAWRHNNKEIHVTNGLYSSQIRSYVLELKKLSSGLWRLNLHSYQVSSKPLSTGINTGFHNVSPAGVAIWEDIGTDLGCGAYIYGGTLLKAGAELMIWGR